MADTTAASDPKAEENKKEIILDDPGPLEKACIYVQEECKVSCGEYEYIEEYKKGDKINAQFNPTSYSISISSNFKEEFAGTEQKNDLMFGEFSGPSRRRLSVKLLYDSITQIDYLDKMQSLISTGKDAVKNMTVSFDGVLDAGKKIYDAYNKFADEDDLYEKYIKRIINLARSSDKGRPPLISFIYGNMKFTGHISNVSVEFKRFNKSGDVIRAEIGISIDEAGIGKDGKSLSEPKVSNIDANDLVSQLLE